MPCRARTQRRGQAWNPWPGRSGAAWPCPCCGARASRPLCHVADLRRRTSGPPLAGGTPALPGRRSLGGRAVSRRHPRPVAPLVKRSLVRLLPVKSSTKRRRFFSANRRLVPAMPDQGDVRRGPDDFLLGRHINYAHRRSNAETGPPVGSRQLTPFPRGRKSCCASPPVAKRPDAGAAGTAHHRAPCPGRRPADASTRNPRRRRFRSLA